MTDKAVALPGHTGFIKNNLRTYGMLMSLIAITLIPELTLWLPRTMGMLR